MARAAAGGHRPTRRGHAVERQAPPGAGLAGAGGGHGVRGARRGWRGGHHAQCPAEVGIEELHGHPEDGDEQSGHVAGRDVGGRGVAAGTKAGVGIFRAIYGYEWANKWPINYARGVERVTVRHASDTCCPAARRHEPLPPEHPSGISRRCARDHPQARHQNHGLPQQRRSDGSACDPGRERGCAGGTAGEG